MRHTLYVYRVSIHALTASSEFYKAECVRGCSGEIGQHARDVVKRKKGVLGRNITSDEDVISIAEDEHWREADNVFSNSDDYTEHKALVNTDS